MRYVTELLEQLKSCHRGFAKTLLGATVEELNRLDPRDFLPQVRSQFVQRRATLRLYVGLDVSHWPHPQVVELCSDLITSLESFAESGFQRNAKPLTFVANDDLRNIIERDYFELRALVFPSAAWKSTVVLAGSILEAVLLDALTASEVIKNNAENSANAPKGKSLTRGDWRLVDLIQVAADIGVLSAERSSTIDQVLRDYRNFVHPSKEIRAEHQCTEAEAYLAVGALDGVFNHLARRAA